MISQEEASLYDRQIRLWGINAQNKIRKAKVLILGFGGTASEIAKILTLAGVDSLTIVDDLPYQDTDKTSNLFCRPPQDSNSEGKLRTHEVISKLRTLNPLVKVNIINEPIVSEGAKHIDDHDLVALCSIVPEETISLINHRCRAAKTKFYMTCDFGLFGFMFNDLGSEFEFNQESHANVKPIEPIDERPKKRLRVHSPDRQTKSLHFATFKEATSSSFDDGTCPVITLALAMIKYYTKFEKLPGSADELIDFLDPQKVEGVDWAANMFGSHSAVCAIVGGVAAQDMIRALAHTGTPIQNTFAFDGINLIGTIERLGLADSSAQPVIRGLIEIDDL